VQTECAGALQEAKRKRAAARADRDQVVPGFGIHMTQDAFDHGLIVQEVLAEPFPGTVTQGVVLVFATEFSGL
jgi:hypothetical protein